MEKMTDARAAEVLAAMREDGGVVADADYTAAIDHAIARLGEPAEAQAQGEAVLPCDVRLPPATTITAGCKLSTLLHALELRAETCTRHFPQVAGSSAPDRMAIKMLVAAGFVTEAEANEALNIAHGFDEGPLAPPSAPVGVKAYPLWQAIHAASEKAGFTCNVGLSQVADALADLAQQPSPVAPVGVERLVVAARKLRDSARGMDDGNRWVPGAVFKQFSKAVTAALAQQPAVVDGADQ